MLTLHHARSGPSRSRVAHRLASRYLGSRGAPSGPRSPTAAGATRAPAVLTLRLIRTTPAWHPPHARCLRLMRGGLTVQSNCTAAFFSPIETTTPTRRIPVARRFPSFPAALRRK